MSEEILPKSPPEQQQEIYNPLVPTSVEQLSALQGQQGVEIVKKRIDILQAARAGSIRLTHPRDWVLFRAESGIYAYLQDSGCERLIDVWGIEVMNVSDLIREDLEDGSFIYTLFGDGYCKLTRQRVEKLIGARDSASMEMGQDNIHPAKLKVETMKAARSNLDGGMVRHLGGLANVPLEEINKIFGRKLDDISGFNLGKGFGTQRARHGDVGEYGPAPTCPSCGKTMRLIPGKDGREPFWGCPDYQTCGQKPITAKKKIETKPESERTKSTRREQEGFTEPKSSEPGKTDEQNLGEMKNKLAIALIKSPKIEGQKRLLKSRIINATTMDELMDIEIELKEKTVS